MESYQNVYTTNSTIERDKSHIIQELTFTVSGKPVAKPRMTRRDKWQTRSCVLDYRMFKDRIRPAAFDAGFRDFEMTILEVESIAYIGIPKSASKKRRADIMGQPHDQKPDTSNILKAVEDALTDDDSKIYRVLCLKLWDDGLGERIEVKLTVRLDKCVSCF